jgi:hypothetical protein
MKEQVEKARKRLFDNPISYEEVIHPEDRAHVLAKLDEATQTGQFNERFRIVSTHGEVRWVHMRGFPVRNAAGSAWWEQHRRLPNRNNDDQLSVLTGPYEQLLSLDDVIDHGAIGSESSRTRAATLCNLCTTTLQALW